MTTSDHDPADRSILVVEDDETIRAWLAQTLKRAGYAVSTAANGSEALDLLQHGPAFDLILLDMLMPVLDGWAFLQQVRAAAPMPRPAIVVVTATILTEEWAADHGCAGFLSKPLHEVPVLIEVRRCLAQPRGASGKKPAGE